MAIWHHLFSMAHSIVNFRSTARWTFLLCACIFGGCREQAPSKFEVTTSSMAPRLQGRHFLATCELCDQSFCVAAESYDSLIPTRCFSCGGPCLVDSTTVRPGDQVALQPLSKSDTIKRFDLVVFRSSRDSQPSDFNVKRVWGLPEESIQLSEGELIVDGRLYQKSLLELVEVSVPLSRFPADRRSHWSWIGADTTSDLAPGADVESRVVDDRVILLSGEQLKYRYQRRFNNSASNKTTLDDDYVTNQNSTAPFHNVQDFFVAVLLERPCDQPWWIDINFYGHATRVEILPIANGDTGDNCIFATNAVVMAVCDGRLLAASDQQLSEILLEQGKQSKIDRFESDELIRIGVNVGELQIRELRVSRDLWLGPRESRLASWNFDGSLDGYFVLGDNLPVSEDSRDQLFGRIQRAQILGRLATSYQLDSNPKWPASWIETVFRSKIDCR